MIDTQIIQLFDQLEPLFEGQQQLFVKATRTAIVGLFSAGSFKTPISIATHLAAIKLNLAGVRVIIPADQTTPRAALDHLMDEFTALENRIPSMGTCLGWVKTWALSRDNPDPQEPFTLETVINLQENDLEGLSHPARVLDFYRRLKMKALQATPRPIDVNQIRAAIASVQPHQRYLVLLRQASSSHAIGLEKMNDKVIDLFDHNKGTQTTDSQPLLDLLVNKLEAYRALGFDYHRIDIYPLAPRPAFQPTRF